MRLSDRSPKWDRATLKCRTCGVDKPPQAFIIRRKTNNFIGDTCQDCRAPRTATDRIRLAVNNERVRARRLGIVNTLTAAQWFAKLEQSCGYCYLCRRYFGTEALTIDHVLALNNGGENTIDNVEAACWECNLHKSTKITP